MGTTTFFGRKYSNLLIATAAVGAVFVAGIESAQATTYYVSSQTGNDHNTGKTTSAPFKTINGITQSGHLAAGDTVVVMPGTYYETVTLHTAGTPGAYTTLMAQAGAARPVIIGEATEAGSAEGDGAINILSPYTRVVGFNVMWQGPTGDAITVWGATAKDSKGVVRPSVHHIDIENNITHDSGCGGIDVINADYVTVIGNMAYNNGNTAPNQCSGISLYQLTDYDGGTGFRNVVSGNVSFNNVDLTPVPGTKYTTDGNGIIIDDSRHTQSDGAAYHGATLVYGNVVYGNGARGICIYASDNVTVANNTAFENQVSSTVQGPHAEISSGGSGKNTFVNNIAMSKGTANPAFADDASTNDSWDYNLTAGGGNALTTPVGLAIGTHNVAGANPDFVAASLTSATASFRLASNSPAIKIGLAVNYGVADVAGQVPTAGVRPNIGAYIR
jgi:parallel beta-helix repeat protein